MKRHRYKRSLFAPPAKPAPAKDSVPTAIPRTAADAAPSEDRGDNLAMSESLPSSRPLPVAGPVLLSVSELTNSIKTVLETRFAKVRVWGEIGNLSPSRSGTFLTLKDAGASIGAVVWNRTLPRIAFDLEEGLEVEVEGELDVYPPRGEYKVIVHSMTPRGQGALQLAFEQLKRRLQTEGLFDRPRKPLPTLPSRIAVITSRDGAAWHDFARVTHRRNPFLDITLIHSRVQGDGAAAELVRALTMAGQWRDAQGRPFDLVVLTRGGGSLEDLWAFNDETLGRAIAAAPVPVVSAVGHEVDWTIADYLADLRAPTPSAAGEMITPEWLQLHRRLADHSRRLQRSIGGYLATRRDKLTIASSRLEPHNPRQRLRERRAHLVNLLQRLRRSAVRHVAQAKLRLETDAGQLRRRTPEPRLLQARAVWERSVARLRSATVQALHTARMAWQSAATRHLRAAPKQPVRVARDGLTALDRRLIKNAAQTLQRGEAELARVTERLEALSPLAILRRGYSVTYDADGRILTSAADVPADALLRSRLADGSLWSKVVPSPGDEIADT